MVFLLAKIVARGLSWFYNGATMSDYDGILQENIWHELKAVREGQDAMAGVPGDIARLKDDMFEVKGDIKVIKAVLKDHSKILKNHSGLLNDHSRLLNDHSRLLNDHSKEIADLRGSLL
jgi:hypothetical protein